MTDVRPSICRLCTAFCPILVTVENGRAVRVTGDFSVPSYGGYTCPKGRALPEQHNQPGRLLHSIKRTGEGGLIRISKEQAIAEIAEKVGDLIARHGARSIATYTGTGATLYSANPGMALAWMRAIGSPMTFSSVTIDKPAAHIANALHGYWMAGPHSFGSADTWLIVGANPIISKSLGLPNNNPGMRLKEAVRRGLKLIVIDPRRTETARRAHVHLQPRPGEDPTILAGLINVIIRERLHNGEFIASHVQGFDELKQRVAHFTPAYVARRADVSEGQLIEAARVFGRGKRGFAVCSTGPSFATHSNLAYYLSLCLNSICGRWALAGEKAAWPNVLLPPFTPKAQAQPPYPAWGVGERLRVRGLGMSASGMPTAALADEILLEGDGQVRALFCMGGNPMMAFPDQRKTYAALNKLELLVAFDCEMSATAELAHYVIPPPLSLETPGMTHRVEWAKYMQPTRGLEQPWAQYTPKVVDPPAGAGLIDEREFFFRLAQRMGLQLDWIKAHGFGRHIENPSEIVPLDMRIVPTADEMFEMICSGSRIPLSEVKKHPHGRMFDEINEVVQPADPDCTDRLDVGNSTMMEELATIHREDLAARQLDGSHPYLLVSRRQNNVMNSIGRSMPGLMGNKTYNPAFMHSADLARLGVAEGDVVIIRSRSDKILGVAETDDTLRPGLVSMAHCFGSNPADEDEDPREVGANTSRLVSLEECDAITGIPRMTAIPVAVAPAVKGTNP